MARIFKKSRLLGAALNLLGLTVAFTAFMVIMIQVLHDWRYDRNYPGSDRTFRLEFVYDPSSPGSYNVTICRPFIEALKGTIPEVEALGTYRFYDGTTQSWFKEDDLEHSWYLPTGVMDTSMLRVFPFEFIEGDPAGFAQPRSVILAESAAGRFFPDESPVGKTLTDYNGNPYRIAAVYKDFPENCSAANGVMIQIADDNLGNWSEWSYCCYMKLRDPADRDKVAEQLKQKMFELLDIESGSEWYKVLENGVRINTLHEAYYSRDVSPDPMAKGSRSTTNSLFAIGLVIIAIAVINFINLATASVPLKIKDINTRKVLGSGRAALVGAQLAEALVLALAAFGLSVLALHFLSGTGFSWFISGSMRPADNLTVLLLGATVAVCTSLLAGIFPAMYSTSFQPALVLKGSFSMSPRGKLLRNCMVGFQFVASFVLIGMALYIRVQTSFMEKMDMGFTRDQVVEFGCGATIGARSESFEQRLRQNPHIKDVTFAGNWLVSDSKMGWGREYDGHRVQLDVLPVSADFIDFFGMTIKEGRGFMPSDELNPDGTFIMNEQTMLKFPFLRLGARLSGHANDPAEIVGIVKDFNFKPLQYGVDPLALYVFGSDPWWPLQVAYAKIDGVDVAGSLRDIRDAVEEFDPTINGDEIRIQFLDESIGELYEKERKLNSLIATAAALSLMVSLIGILGMVSFETRFRRKEIAVRKVHGADTAEILKMQNRHYVLMTLICFVVAVPLLLTAMKAWVRSFAYQAPVPVWIFAVSFLAVAAVTVLTVTLQSWKAASSNPVDSLHDE